MTPILTLFSLVSQIMDENSNFGYSEWSKRGHGLASGYLPHILSSGGHFPSYSLILWHIEDTHLTIISALSCPLTPPSKKNAKNGTNISDYLKYEKNRALPALIFSALRVAGGPSAPMGGLRPPEITPEFPTIPIDFRRFPSISDNSRRFPTIPIDFRWFPSISDDSRQFPPIYVDSRQFPTISVDSRRFPSIPANFRRFPSPPKTTKTARSRSF